MKARCGRTLLLLCVSLFALGPRSAAAQSMRSLVGAWRLVEYWNRDSASAPKYEPYGARPCGYIIYSASGHVSVNFAASPLAGRLPADSLNGGVPRYAAEALAILSRTVAYFGTYSVDSARGILVHRIDADVRRVNDGSADERPFRLRGDTLVIGNGLTWQRSLVREPPGPARANPACTQPKR